MEEATGLPRQTTLWGIWGSSATDLWAVGGSIVAGPNQGLLLRSAGDGVWTRVDDPALPELGNLFKAWGTGPDDVYLVGEGGVAIHWDGVAYTRVDWPEPEQLFTVHGNAAGLVLTVGGNRQGLILRWTPSGWVDDGTPAELPPLNGVYVLPDGRAYATGAQGRILQRTAAGEWSLRPRDELRSFGTNTLHAVWAPDEIWVVGGDFSGGAVGAIGTTRLPLPTLAIEPLVVPPPPDAGVDASPPDAAPIVDAAPPDASVDASVVDAAPDAAPTPDRGAPDQGPAGDARVVADAQVDMAPADAAPAEDARPDAARPVDAAPDQAPPDARPDQGRPDALPVDQSPPDARPDDVGVDAAPGDIGVADAAVLPDPGEACPGFECNGESLCLRFWQLRQLLCTDRCEEPADCAAYGPDPCCVVPGPQTLDGYCAPSHWFDGRCFDF